MAKIKPPGWIHIPGIQPGEFASNRRFWDDPFVEPKQQHRFGILMPVYMNMGADDTTQVAQLYASAAGLDTASLANKDIPLGSQASNPPVSETVEGNDEADAPDVPPPTLTVAREATDNGVAAAIGDAVQASAKTSLGKNTLKIGPKKTSQDKLGNYVDSDGADGGVGGLYLRMSEYVGYSFTPPGFTYEQGYMERGQVKIPDPESRSYTIGDAQLTFVTTLRDDFHWSLNFLFAVGAYADATKPVSLFPELVVTSDTPKTLVIKEYSARQDPLAASYDDAAEDGLTYDIARSIASAPARVVGLHKFNDPVIKGATFDPFTYGGTDLIKVTITLGYGAGQQKDWYSYKATTSRYGRSYFTFKEDAGARDEHIVPKFNWMRRAAAAEYPNLMEVVDRQVGSETRAKLKARMKEESQVPNKERINLIRDRMEEGDPIKINELVSKSIQTLLDEKAAAEAQDAEDQRVRDARAAQDGTFEEQINREEQATIDRLKAQTENTEIPNYIRREEIRLEHEQWRRDRAAARGPGTPSPTWSDPVDRTFDPLEGIENTAGSAPPSSSDP